MYCFIHSRLVRCWNFHCKVTVLKRNSSVGCVAQLAERRSLAGELTLSYTRPAADGWPLCG